MCGLVGIFYKGEGAEGPVGDVIRVAALMTKGGLTGQAER